MKNKKNVSATFCLTILTLFLRILTSYLTIMR